MNQKEPMNQIARSDLAGCPIPSEISYAHNPGCNLLINDFLCTRVVHHNRLAICHAL